MSGQDKTEKPTAKRLSEARRRGQIAKSADLTSAFVLGGIALTLMIYGPNFLESLVRTMRAIFHNWLLHPEQLTANGWLHLLGDVLGKAALILVPFLAVPLVVGVLVNCFQTRFLFTTKTLKVSLDSLNPVNGFQRLFSQRTVVELVKGMVKLLIVGFCCYMVIQGKLDHLLATSQMGFAQAWALIFQTMIDLCGLTAIIMLVLGIADYVYQKKQHIKKLKMTKQEVKDEMKNTEGDPKIKGKIKAVGRAMARKRMLQAVPNADVIVTNPTHYSIAIQYDPDVCPAPRVIAKGVDELAFRIREIAVENKIPLVENRPLARSLYDLVEVDHMIPPNLFIAVAEVLAFVFNKHRSRCKPGVRKLMTGRA